MPPESTLTSSRIALAVAAAGAGVLLAALDQTVVVTVLPEMMVDLDLSVTELDRVAWTVTGYLLGYTAVMPLMGRLSDAYGRRPVYLLALLFFGVGSALVALSTSLPWLVAARVIQAMGGGAMLPVTIALVGDLIASGRRGPALGLVGAIAEAGGVLGPLWGGLIVRFLDWRWIFWLNIPLGLIIAVLVLLAVPRSRYQPIQVDYLGGLLLVASLSLLTVGLAQGSETPGIALALFLASVAAFGLFWRRQQRAPLPLVPLRLFGRLLSAASASHFLVGGALIIVMITVPLITDTVLGQPPLEGGLRLLRLTAAIPVGAVLGGLALRRWDYRVPMALGLSLAAGGAFLLSRWGPGIADPAMTLHLATTGLGFGLVVAPIAAAALDAVSAEHRGTAAALVMAMRMVGMTVGLAALTAWGGGRFDVLTTQMQSPFGLEASQLAAFEDELAQAGLTLFREFFRIAVIVCLVALVPAWFMRRRQG